VGGSLQLTPATTFLAGSEFWPTAIPSRFTASFDATISNGSGADGLALDLINPSDGATALGAGGGGLGFSGLHGVAVTEDTWRNQGDPTNNFVGLADGPGTTADSLHYAGTDTAVPGLRNATHHLVVVVTPSEVKVSVGGSPALDVTGLSLPANVLLGFSAVRPAERLTPTASPISSSAEHVWAGLVSAARASGRSARLAAVGVDDVGLGRARV